MLVRDLLGFVSRSSSKRSPLKSSVNCLKSEYKSVLASCFGLLKMSRRSGASLIPMSFR